MFNGAANGRPPQVSNARPGPPVLVLRESYFLGEVFGFLLQKGGNLLDSSNLAF
jgi:hypothetical protein